MNSEKKIKKGSLLVKEGDPVSTVYLIQTGKIGLMHERSGKRLEVATLGNSQALGESGLFSNSKHPFTAEALQDCKYLEVPLDMMKQQFEKTPPGIKLLLKSLSDDVRQARQLMKMNKMESEKSPCPQGSIHRIFTLLHLIARHIGKKSEAQPHEVLLSWSAFKLYVTRFFGESPQRMRHLMDLLAKLKLAELTLIRNEEGEEELSEVKLLNVQVCEDFAEFYQYHLYKGSRAEAIYVDPLALKVAKAFYEVSQVAEVDHKGASRVDYGMLLTECKNKYNIDLKNTHLDVLERKGLFATRQSFEDGRVVLAFDRIEFGKMSQYWAIILEIDKWNERGSVDLNEKEEVMGSASGACPQCSTPRGDAAKFCANCGTKLAA